MKKYLLQLIIVLATSLIACSNQQKTQAATQEKDSVKLDAAAFSEKFKSSANAVLIDVRTPEEFSKGHIEHAKNADWNSGEFKKQVAHLDKSKPVFVYCLSGGRSTSAIEFLQAAGFKEVYELDGGIMKWTEAGLPLVAITTPTEVTSDMSLEDFQKLLSQTDKYILVDYYAVWCGPCRQMEPDLEDIAETMKDKVIVVRIDVEKNPTLSKHFDIESLPTIQIYKNQKLVWEDIGYRTKKQLVSQLK